VQNLLRPLGLTVFVARDGKTCLELAAECQPDLAMIDLSMPDMSGWSVVQALRADSRLENLKIMIVSANAHEYSPRPDAQHDSFAMKPIQLQRLLEQIGVLLSLNWIYAPDAAETAGQRGAAAGGNLTCRSRHHLDDLYRLGRIGHVRGIEAKLRELELEDSANDAFAAHLRTLVSNFDLKRYMSVLENMRADA
jgi:CheY-like chemotaxis protein